MSYHVDLDSDCDHEILWTQLELVGSKHILVGAFYRPPDSGSKVLDQLHNSLSKDDVSKNQSIRLAGD